MGLTERKNSFAVSRPQKSAKHFTTCSPIHLHTNVLIFEYQSNYIFKFTHPGRSPHWYLRSILITDTKSKTEYPFVCDDWLSVAETENPSIDRTLPLASEEDLKKFHLVFASKISKGLMDGHIWLSIFLRPKRSSFTRVRRLSACLALLFLTMLTNAMFFGVGDAPGSRKIIWLGNFKINFTGIMIGIQSSIIVIPPSIIIVEIFRRVAPKKEKKKGK